MGADITIRKPKGLDEDELFRQCEEVPIDCWINNGWINFHYAYWGQGHAMNCERFVDEFVEKHNLKMGKWGY